MWKHVTALEVSATRDLRLQLTFPLSATIFVLVLHVQARGQLVLTVEGLCDSHNAPAPVNMSLRATCRCKLKLVENDQGQGISWCMHVVQLFFYLKILIQEVVKFVAMYCIEFLCHNLRRKHK